VSNPDCSLCAEIPALCDVDLRLGEDDFPLEHAEQLTGWPDTLCVPLRRELSCPRCDGRYRLEIETGGLEWDLRLVRVESP
jgi:hypothetical protein